MLYSELFGKTVKEISSEEVSLNAKLLTRAGFIRRETAGVYNFLPLGLRVLNKISNIVRDEMNKTGGQELLLSALQNKKNWEQTGRWSTFDALFKIKSQQDSQYPLGPTHEEVIVPIVKQFVNSYRNLPLYLYQIQLKFRDELRAKSGILRGREFLMKDLYSFHSDELDFEGYYERMINSYQNVFKRCGVKAILAEAGGGEFSKFSHEFQTLTPNGEDIIFYCNKCNFAQNKEITKVKAGDKCPKCQEGIIEEGKSIEVGNVFPLKTKFSEAFNLTYKDKEGNEKFVIMGCYGLGISRLMGTIVEVHNDDKGIIWPKEVAPFQVHLIGIMNHESRIMEDANKIYGELEKAGAEVLFDDRIDVSAGEKFADADLIGIPLRVVVSQRTGEKLEVKKRSEKEVQILDLQEFFKLL